MAKRAQGSIPCGICGRVERISHMLPAELVRASVAEVQRRNHPDWDGRGYVCREDLNRFRAEYIEGILAAEKGDLTTLEAQVLKSLGEHELLSSNVNVEIARRLTLRERAADRIASFGGSWRFLFIFAGIMLAWILVNSVLLIARPFDPYPYILLNVVLSCLAAVQAPVIMMSQNRQEDRDRLRAENDYRINLKAELEIRHLHEKIDHLLLKQWQRLVEIQEIQLDIMEELSRGKK